MNFSFTEHLKTVKSKEPLANMPGNGHKITRETVTQMNSDRFQHYRDLKFRRKHSPILHSQLPQSKM